MFDLRRFENKIKYLKMTHEIIVRKYIETNFMFIN